MHNIRYFFCISFILITFLSEASVSARIFEFQKNAEMSIIKDYCFYYLEDNTDSENIPADSLFFHSSDKRLENLGKQYWIRFTIRNSENSKVKIQLFPGLCENMVLFFQQDGKLKRHSIGVFEKRSKVTDIWGYGKTFMSQALVHLESQETKTFYVNFHHLSGGQQAKRDSKIEPRLMDGEEWQKKIFESNVIWSFIFGCFVILFLYHIVFYFITKDAIYLYYCLFVFAVSFPFYTLVYHLFDLPQFGALLFFTVSGLFSVFYFQLTRKLIGLKEILPKWDKILRYSIVIKSSLVGLYTIIYQFIPDIFVILSIYIPAIVVEFFLMGFLAVALLKTRNRIALFFVLGSSLAWLSMTIAILSADAINSLTPQMAPWKYATPAIGFVLESLAFAMVLSYRVRLNEIERKNAQDALIFQLKENTKIQEKANIELEQKVIERTGEIEIEKNKTEKLLLNMLPESVVIEIKDGGKSIPRKFENVSVLFADFVGFTAIASKMSPEDLVLHLNDFFEVFDAIMLKHGLEKIKTIGDAYLSVCGIPSNLVDHAVRTVKAAQEMINYTKEYNSRNPSDHNWEIRVGINSGEVVAGVIGNYKFAYDIWGDTVNLASRLETNSVSCKINVSENTFKQINSIYRCTDRGEVQVKNNTTIKMYFVEGII